MNEEREQRPGSDPERDALESDGAPGSAGPMWSGSKRPVDLEAKAKLDAHKDAIVALLAEGPERAWEVGQRLRSIVQENLARRAGYRTVDSFIVRELPASKTTIRQYQRLHKQFTEAEVRRFGPARLARFSTYRALTGCAREADLGETLIRVPQPDGCVAGKRFVDCSKRHLMDALRLARVTRGRPASNELMQRLNDALARATGGRVGASASVGRHEHTWVRLDAFDLADLCAVTDALLLAACEVEARLKDDPLAIL